MMKRNLALLLAAIIASSMIACGGKDAGSTDTDNGTDTSAVTETEGVVVDATKPVGMLYNHFKDFVTANPDATAEQIANDLITDENLPFSPIAAEMPEGYLNGFSEDITGFTSAWAFQPMIGAIPFVGYIFTVDEANIDAFKENLVAKHNMAWNVCTQADDMICESIGDKVFFLMAPASFEEEPIDDLG